MSKLYAEIYTDRNKTVSRRGHRHITTHTRGWDIGIKVCCETDVDGRVKISVYQTGGSNNPSNEQLIEEIYE